MVGFGSFLDRTGSAPFNGDLSGAVLRDSDDGIPQISGSQIQASGNLDLSGTLSLPIIQLATTGVLAPAHQEGQLYWDPDDKTLTIDMDITDVRLQVGQELYTRIVNKTGNQLDNGTVVFLSGSQGNRPTVWKADATIPSASDMTIGFLTADVLVNQEGYCTTYGLVRKLNTLAWPAGTPLYLSATTPGSASDTAPAAPNHTVKLGQVHTSHGTQGEILVRIDNGEHLGALHDVSCSCPPLSSSYLQYVAENQRWEDRSSPRMYRVEVDAATYTTTVNDYYLGVTYSATGDTAITLATATVLKGFNLLVKDEGGLAGTNNITIDTEGAETIDGQASVVIGDNYGFLRFISDGTNWFMI